LRINGTPGFEPGTCLKVLWKRGPQTDYTRLIKIEDGQKNYKLYEAFSKISSFYYKEAGTTFSDNVTYEEKMCVFQLNASKDEEDENMIAVVEVNMSKHVNK